MISRHHRDGNGVLRHMAGYRRAHPLPRGTRPEMPLLAAELPRAFMLDNTSKAPVLDQAQAGSCCGESFAGAGTYVIRVRQGGLAQLSGMFAYDIAREAGGGALDEDSGASIRDMHDAAGVYGVCEESLDPYDWTKFGTPPTDAQKANALGHVLTLTLDCPTLDTVKHAIMQGWPVQFGFTCFQSLMSQYAAGTGEIPTPEKGEASVGAHAVYAIGWDDDYKINDATGIIYLRNSWGAWGCDVDGVRGHGRLPQAYFTSGLAGEAHCPRVFSPKVSA